MNHLCHSSHQILSNVVNHLRHSSHQILSNEHSSTMPRLHLCKRANFLEPFILPTISKTIGLLSSTNAHAPYFRSETWPHISYTILPQITLLQNYYTHFYILFSISLLDDGFTSIACISVRMALLQFR